MDLVLHWFGFLAFGLAAYLGIRWSLARYDSLGRPRPFPWWSCVFFVLLGLALLVPWVLRLRLQSELAEAASQVVGREVEVHCQSFGEAFVDVGAENGYVAFGPDGVPELKTLIKRNQCADLRDYLNSEKSAPTQEQIVAVHTLTHEAIHMSGVTNEAETECTAVQRDAEMARLLGASETDAQLLASSYWQSIWPRMPENYRKSDCPGPAPTV
jgi:hypothetical protein